LKARQPTAPRAAAHRTAGTIGRGARDLYIEPFRVGDAAEPTIPVKSRNFH
jgi:hypothetical protein